MRNPVTRRFGNHANRLCVTDRQSIPNVEGASVENYRHSPSLLTWVLPTFTQRGTRRTRAHFRAGWRSNPYPHHYSATFAFTDTPNPHRPRRASFFWNYFSPQPGCFHPWAAGCGTRPLNDKKPDCHEKLRHRPYRGTAVIQMAAAKSPRSAASGCCRTPGVS